MSFWCTMRVCDFSFSPSRILLLEPKLSTASTQQKRRRNAERKRVNGPVDERKISHLYLFTDIIIQRLSVLQIYAFHLISLFATTYQSHMLAFWFFFIIFYNLAIVEEEYLAAATVYSLYHSCLPTKAL